MAPLRYAAKFDCAPTPSTLPQSKERKISNLATLCNESGALLLLPATNYGADSSGANRFSARRFLSSNVTPPPKQFSFFGGCGWRSGAAATTKLEMHYKIPNVRIWPLMFDCYLTENWSYNTSEAGPIRFNGCGGKDRSHYSIPQYYLSFCYPPCS